MFRISIIIFFLFFSLKSFCINATFTNTVFYMLDTLKGKNMLPYVETNWQIIQHSLHYKTTPNNMLEADLKVELIYRNDTGIIVQDKFEYHTPARFSIADIDNHKIQDLRRYFITNGLIRMSIKLQDKIDTNNIYYSEDTFTVKSYIDQPFLSNLQLIDTIYDTDTDPLFSKNGVVQVPLSMNFIDDENKTLRYYAELYQTEKIPIKDFPLYQKVSISKKLNEIPLKHFTNIDTINNYGISLVYGIFNIADLPSGNYYLTVAIENNTKKKIAGNSLFFQLLNKHPVKEKLDTVKKNAYDSTIEKVNFLNLNETFIAKYTYIQLRAMLKMMLPLLDADGTSTVKNFLDNPDELYMRYFIYNFFHAKNEKDPTKAWKEYSTQIIEVNKLFNDEAIPGYETERGFLYLRYGPPTERINVDNERGSLPYEIWLYNNLKQKNNREIANAVFLFYKSNQAIKDYQLLHCNVQGERQNMGWRNFLYQQNNGNYGSSAEHKAELYLQGM